VRGILGPARYRYWKEGKLELNKMVLDNKILGLDELGKVPSKEIKPLVPSLASELETKIGNVVVEVPVDEGVKALASPKKKLLKLNEEIEDLVNKKQLSKEDAKRLRAKLAQKNKEWVQYLNSKGYFGGVWIGDDEVELLGHLIPSFKEVPKLFKLLKPSFVEKELGKLSLQPLVENPVVQDLKEYLEWHSGIKDTIQYIQKNKDKINNVEALRRVYQTLVQAYEDGVAWEGDFLDLAKTPSKKFLNLVKASPDEYKDVLVAEDLEHVLFYAHKKTPVKEFKKLLSELDSDLLNNYITSYHDLKGLKPSDLTLEGRIALITGELLEPIIDTLKKADLGTKAFEALTAKVGGAQPISSLEEFKGFLNKLETIKMDFNDIKVSLELFGGEKFTKKGSIIDAILFEIESFKNILVDNTDEKVVAQILKKAGVKTPFRLVSKDDVYTITIGDKYEAAQTIKEVNSEYRKWLRRKKKEKVKPKPSPKEQKTPTYQLYDYSEVDKNWEKVEFAQKLESAPVGATHESYFVYDKEGNKWFFKPADREPFRAYVDEMAYKLSRLIDPDAIETRIATINKRIGSVQRWVEGAQGISSDVTTLSDEAVEWFQKQHVVDWLISNHDAHAGQFLKKGNKLFAIDKGQAGRFLGKDELSLTYHPNSVYGTSPPIYNFLYEAVKKGKLKMNPQATLKAIKKAEQIPDKVWADIIRPYAKERARALGESEDWIIEQFLKRKADLRTDFEEFFKTIFGEGFEFEEEALALDPKTLLKEIKKAQWAGKAVKVDAEDIEDLTALFWIEEDAAGKELLRMKVKLTEKALIRLENRLRSTLGEDLTLESKKDEFYTPFLNAAKSILYHESDKNFNMSKLEKASAIAKRLKELSAKTTDPELKSIAKYYAKWGEAIEGVFTAVNEGAGIKESIEALKALGKLKKYAPKPKKGAVKELPFKVKKRVLKYDVKDIKSGKAKIAGSMESPIPNYNFNEYVVTFDDGSELIFRGKEFTISHQGEVELLLHDMNVESAFKKLDLLGISTKPPSKEYEEILYLWQHAYAWGLENEPKLLEILKLDNEKEKLKKLREYWSQRLGVKDVTKLKGYNPSGDTNFFDRGYVRRYRFDGLGDELREKNIRLFHRFDYQGVSKLEHHRMLEHILNSGGKFSSRTERLRLGQPVQELGVGASPEVDMRVGGANYFFLAPCKEEHLTPGIVCKKHVADRIDARWYTYDSYGTVLDRNSMAFSPDEIIDAHINQVTVKHGLDLWSDIEYWLVPWEADKKKMIEVMKKHGFDKMPDGRSFDEFFKVYYSS